jgi:PWWP domain
MPTTACYASPIPFLPSPRNDGAGIPDGGACTAPPGNRSAFPGQREGRPPSELAVGGAQPPGGSKKAKKSKPGPPLPPGFAYGDIVWAKGGSWPWWPGELQEPNERHLRHLKGKKDQVLVVYFGDNREFKVLPVRLFVHLWPSTLSGFARQRVQQAWFWA